MKSFALAIGLLAGFSAPLLAQPNSSSAPQLVSVKKIWHGEKHSAFTDLIRFDGKWFCTFREAEGHEGLLWLSYYSSHEGATDIYLAKVRLSGAVPGH